MKKMKILSAVLLSSLLTNSFAQPKLDATIDTNAARNSTSFKAASFGYHHGNYKHPVKARMSESRFRLKGHSNRTAVVSNYKRVYSSDSARHTVSVNEPTTHKTNRNYKRPH